MQGEIAVAKFTGRIPLVQRNNGQPVHFEITSKLLKCKGKVYPLFIDLKAAFRSIDRDKLWECMKKKESGPESGEKYRR